MDKEVKMQLVCEKYMRSVSERLQKNGARIQGYSNVTVHLDVTLNEIRNRLST